VIRATRYVEGRPGGERLDGAALGAVSAGAVVWIDVESPSATELATLGTQLGLHRLIVEDLLNPRQRTKLVRYHDRVHVALRDCELVGDDLAAREVDVVVAPGWVLTVRHPDALSAAPRELAAEIEQRFETRRDAEGGGATTAGFLTWAVVDVIVDRYFDVTDGFDARLEAVEDIVFSDNADAIPREIFELRSAMVAFRRSVAPLREVLAEVLRREVHGIDEQAVLHVQDVFDHVLRILDLIESQRELLTGLLESQLAIMSNRMNQVMKATSSWGAILIVATLVAGIYGMNFRHMPELDWRYGYPFALGVMGVITLALYRVFKRRGWL
jgi:magnesium transporter